MAATKEPQQQEPTLPGKRKPDSDTQLQPPVKTQKVVDPTNTTTTDPDVKLDGGDKGVVVSVEEEEEYKKKVDRKGKGIMILDEKKEDDMSTFRRETMNMIEEELLEMRDRKGKGIMVAAQDEEFDLTRKGPASLPGIVINDGKNKAGKGGDAAAADDDSDDPADYKMFLPIFMVGVANGLVIGSLMCLLLDYVYDRS
ncbi:hypothetical protein ACFE04_023251 [Oxalis oulophora]